MGLYTFNDSDQPIIPSFLWTDEYKLTMGQLVWLLYPDIPVRFSLTNRTKGINLVDLVEEKRLREELDYVRSLKLTKHDRAKLETVKRKDGEPLFLKEYLDYLENVAMPPYELSRDDRQYKLHFCGKWSGVIYWEIPALTVINTMANETRYKANGGLAAWESSRKTGDERLTEKIRVLKTRPDIRFVEFGTRRTDSPAWLDHVIERLVHELDGGQLTGTSNVYLGLKHGIPVSGTMAHELFMAKAGIMYGSDEEIHASHNSVLDDWEKVYGLNKAIILSDTFGSDFAFNTITEERARLWDGFRQDSGDPIHFGEKEIAFYNKFGIDPREKLLVASDGLTIETIIHILDHFKGRINCSFGWGTNLTNDVGLKALSIVIKLIEANGHGTVKLSDNLAKALGTPEDIVTFKRIFGYTGDTYVEVQY